MTAIFGPAGPDFTGDQIFRDWASDCSVPLPFASRRRGRERFHFRMLELEAINYRVVFAKD